MIKIILLGIVSLFSGWIMFSCWMIAGESQGITCRKEYLKSLLRQEVGWFDCIEQSEVASRFETDCFTYQSGIGEKIAILLLTFSMFISGSIIAFIYGWMMTLVMLCLLPTIVYGGYFFIVASADKDKK